MGIYLGLGSNVGDRRAHLRFAVDAFRDKGIVPWSCASLYWTQPRDVERQPLFLKTGLEVRTLLEPEPPLQECLAIGRRAGAVRDVPKGQRSLDIDSLIYSTRIVEEPHLASPHPRFRER